MSDPLLEMIADDEWMSRLFRHPAPAAKALKRWLTHDVLPVVMSGNTFTDDGTLDRLTADLFIEVPELRPQAKELH